MSLYPTWTRAMVSHLSKIAPSLEPSWSESLGRHLVAKTPVKTGEIVVRERVPVFANPSGVGLPEIIGSKDIIKAHFPFFSNLHYHVNEAKRGFFKGLDPDDYQTMERIETNGFDTGFGTKTFGLSLFVAMASHQCEPSTSYGLGNWEGYNELRALALSDLKQGDKVTIRYGRCQTMPGDYGFKPRCKGACEANLGLDRLPPIHRRFILDLQDHPPTGEMILVKAK
jgi:hypothetical protein